MRIVSAGSIWVGAVCALSTAAAQETNRPATNTPRETAITHVTIVDVVSGGLLQDQTVTISGNRIRQVGRSASVHAGSSAVIIDGRGKFLIPGLWDMHTHIFQNYDAVITENHGLSFPLFIANGVTAVRDMYTTLEDIARAAAWTRAEEAGTLAGPAIVPTSTMITGGAVREAHTIIITNPDAGRRVIDSLVAGGARAIKVQEGLSREVYFAIADEAKVKGVMLVGHVAIGITSREAAIAGQHSIEHSSGVPDGCSREEAEIVRQRLEPPPHPGLRQFVRDTYDDSTCRALARTYIEHGTWLVPTSDTKAHGVPDDSLRTGHRGYAYAPARDRAEWARLPVMDSAQAAVARAGFGHSLALVGLMSRNGVGIMAGTDANAWQEFGFSLQDELALMVAAGLSPLEALRTATLNPARFLHATDSLGSVATGHVADLVLLDANPLLDIHNTRRIRAVLRAGRLFDRAALDSLLDQARRVADGMK
jgi:imidazolonepropionase-like amidohydrolase